MRLWDKGIELHQEIERFTIGEDAQLDRELWTFDLKASGAHARMLRAVGLIAEDELSGILGALEELIGLDDHATLELQKNCEDVHTAIEGYLTSKLGEAGRMIHTGRSRNDQVLTALRLLEKEHLQGLLQEGVVLRTSLAGAMERFGYVALPGYTHMRRAMPTTVATWLGSFVAASEDNELLLRSVLALVDQSPLGTAAGFGVPVLPIDRQMTSDLLGFAKVQENPIYAQLSRGKFEAMILDACTAVLYDLNRLASDLLLFQTKEFSFVMLPTELCTGSSIMPQKKNPDVLELLRAKYHAVLGDAFQIKSLPANLISGYNRDLQLTKGPLIRGLKTTHECLRIMSLVLDRLRIDEAACKNAMSEEIYATEQAYELVLQGMPFRDAYRKVAERFDSN